MSDLLKLVKLADDTANKVKKIKSEAVPKIALEVLKNLEIETPVDTSKALSNWQITLGSQSWALLPAHFAGGKGSTRKQSIQETISQAIITLNNRTEEQDVYITNNLPYIKRLNNGYSSQAPKGFVEACVLKGHKKIPTLRF